MGSFNVSEFKSRGLKQAGYRPSLFKIRFPSVPPGISSLQDLEFTCKAGEIPPSIIQPTSAYYFGRETKYAGSRVFPDWNISVYCDEDFRHRNVFEMWQNKINALKSNRQDSEPDALIDYKVTAEVLALGKAGPGDDSGAVRAYQFEGVWPNAIDGIRLDWENGNSIATFDVTLSFDLWEPTIFHPSVTPFSGTLPPDPVDGGGGQFPTRQ